MSDDCEAKLAEAMRILALFQEAQGVDPETGPYTDWDALQAAYTALREFMG